MKTKNFIIILVVALLLLIGAGCLIFSNLIESIKDFDKPNTPVQEASSSQTTQEQELPSDSESEEISSSAQTQPSEESEDSTQDEEPEESSVPQSTAPTEQVEVTTQPTQQNPQEVRIDELIAMVYALRDEYTARLYQIEQDAIAQYRALPKEEQTAERKQEIAYAAVDEAYALEKECDGRINEICLELGTLLIETGGDVTMLNQIRHVYASEKTAAKNELTERYAALLG